MFGGYPTALDAVSGYQTHRSRAEVKVSSIGPFDDGHVWGREGPYMESELMRMK